MYLARIKTKLSVKQRTYLLELEGVNSFLEHEVTCGLQRYPALTTID